MTPDELDSQIEAKEIEVAEAQKKINLYADPVSLKIDTPAGLGLGAIEEYRQLQTLREELKALKLQARNARL